MRWILPALFASLVALPAAADDGFVPLFNGTDFTGWKVPDGDNGHWKIVNGVIDYDARSEGKKKDLVSEKSFKDFVLKLDWRMKTDEPGCLWKVPVLNRDGSTAKTADGQDQKVEIEDIDSGIFLRGSPKSQVNIWCWPIGSGEVYGYRTDAKMPAEVRAAVTPRKKADKPKGEWNTFVITLKGERLTVVLNGETVVENAQLPGIPAEGPIVLQHHGSLKDGKWTSPPSLVQFRDIQVKELK